MTGSEHSTYVCGVPRAERIACINDQLRTKGEGGRILITSGVQALSGYGEGALLHALADYDDFDPDNDPHGERDFGGFDYLEAELLWKVDYYDLTLTFHSDDPADPNVTTRVLTIMLAVEY